MFWRPRSVLLLINEGKGGKLWKTTRRALWAQFLAVVEEEPKGLGPRPKALLCARDLFYSLMS